MKRATIGTTLAAGALALSLGLVGCGSNDAAKTDSTATETTEASEQTTDGTAETTSEGATETTAEGTAASDAAATGKAAEISVSDEAAAQIAQLEEANRGHASAYADWNDWYDHHVSDMRSWTVAFDGATSNGLNLYYAGDAAGTTAALFVVDSGVGGYWSYAGNVVDLGGGNCAIVDDYSGNTIYLTTNHTDYDGSVYISLGNGVEGVFAPCPVSEVLNTMDAIEDYGYSLSYY